VSFLLVVLATLPVTLPFVFVADAALALRVSNGVGPSAARGGPRHPRAGKAGYYPSTNR
jgi:hypothetical protein